MTSEANLSDCLDDVSPDPFLADACERCADFDSLFQPSEFDLFPLPCLSFPDEPVSASARVRNRFTRKRRLCRHVNGLIRFLNFLYRGFRADSHSADFVHSLPFHQWQGARLSVLRKLFCISKRFLEDRRVASEMGLPTCGQQAVASLIKQSKIDNSGYAAVASLHTQVPLIADAIVEPSDDGIVDMLNALPPRESRFYRAESNCISWVGKSATIVEELEGQFAFVGGSLDEYIRYFGRPDLPTDMWSWLPFSEVKSVSGFAVVPKKDGITQRKLLMSCTFNYLLNDPRKRSCLGMSGAGALSRVHAGSEGLSIAACDQSNAFTRVRVPDWMIPYLATPPVVASLVWDLLSEDLKCRITLNTMVSPCYHRLPMGCSHSVHILMSINMQVIGMTLRANLKMNRTPAELDDRDDECSGDLEVRKNSQELTPPFFEEKRGLSFDSFRDGMVDDTAEQDELFFGCSDVTWWERFQLGAGKRQEAGYSVDEWWKAIRDARQADHRTIVVMNFFAGERRAGDIQSYVESLSFARKIPILMISVDLASDDRWDLSDHRTFHEILQMLDGYVDIILGGPPCSTVSRARHNRRAGGPRPLRFRWCIWGRSDLTFAEQARVRESNILWAHFMLACERVSGRGGAHLWEHPEDPGHDPFPSIWCTDEMIQLEKRTGAIRVSFSQCVLGAPVRKRTTVSGTLDDLETFDHFQCPGVGVDGHHHFGCSAGTDKDGHFHTRRLQTYPPRMCEQIARCVVNTAARMLSSGKGPTGYLLPEGIQAVPTEWSFPCSGETVMGVDLLNEQVEKHCRTLLSTEQAGVYLHVDDTVVFCSNASPHHADVLMNQVAEGMEGLGFVVPERVTNEELSKVIGYAWDPSRQTFCLPLKKRMLLYASLIELSNQRCVNVDVLRAVVGVWSFGAQLRRDVYSVPFTLYGFIDKFQGSVVPLWDSVRVELLQMAWAVRFMELAVDLPFSKSMLATDAMGSNELDHGGFGVCVTQVSDEELASLRASAEQPGFALNMQDSEVNGLPHPERVITPTVPFSVLPDQLFDLERWKVVMHGRWKFSDPIAIGEARSVCKALRYLASDVKNFDQIWYSLQDNMVCKSVFTRGRSSCWGLNVYARNKAALVLSMHIRLILPWVQSSKMPADRASRLQ